MTAGERQGPGTRSLGPVPVSVQVTSAPAGRPPEGGGAQVSREAAPSPHPAPAPGTGQLRPLAASPSADLPVGLGCYHTFKNAHSFGCLLGKHDPWYGRPLLSRLLSIGLRFLKRTVKLL